MRDNNRLSRRIHLAIAALSALLLLVAGVSRYSIGALSRAVQGSNETCRTELQLNQLLLDMVDTETGERGYLITHTERFLEPHTRGALAARRDLKTLKAELVDPQQARRVDAIRAITNRKLDLEDRMIAFERAGRHEAAAALTRTGQGKTIMDDLRTQLARAIAFQEDRFKAQRAQAERTVGIAATTLTGCILLGALISLLLSSWLNRQVVRPIRTITHSIAASSSQMATTVDEHERVASQQASSVSETTTTMEELGSSFQLTASQAETAASSAGHSLDLAQQGTHAVEQTAAEIQIVEQRVGAIAERILHLSDRTAQIGSVIDLVGDLASQTHMLALNAAVEAAHAGDQGRGFAVVAAEIRKLADQSKRSSEQIKLLVQEIQTATHATVMATDEGTKSVERGLELSRSTGETFVNLAEAVRFAHQNVQQISLNVQQQAAAIQQVTVAMISLDDGARAISTGIAQTRSTVGSLDDTARRLKAIVG